MWDCHSQIKCSPPSNKCVCCHLWGKCFEKTMLFCLATHWLVKKVTWRRWLSLTFLYIRLPSHENSYFFLFYFLFSFFGTKKIFFFVNIVKHVTNFSRNTCVLKIQHINSIVLRKNWGNFAKLLCFVSGTKI